MLTALPLLSATQIAADKDWTGTVDKLVIKCLDCDPLLFPVRLLNIHVSGLRQIPAICLYLYDFIQTGPKQVTFYPLTSILKKKGFLTYLKGKGI